MKKRIEKIIKSTASNPGTETRYREPLVGFASADDPIFDEMKETIGQHHMHPKEVFPEAKTVVSFFLPFEEKLVDLNWKSPGPVREWILAKSETESLIKNINEKLNEIEVGRLGLRELGRIKYFLPLKYSINYSFI